MKLEVFHTGGYDVIEDRGVSRVSAFEVDTDTGTLTIFERFEGTGVEQVSVQYSAKHWLRVARVPDDGMVVEPGP